MRFWQANDEYSSDEPPDETFAQLKTAFTRVGKPKTIDEAKRVVEGNIWYGFQCVKVRAEVIDEDGDVEIKLTAWSDDVWAGGAKKAIDFLCDALDRHDDPDFVPLARRSGMPSPLRMMGGMIGSLLAVFGIFHWSRGRHQVPGGAVETFELVSIGVGLLIVLLSVLWPRRRT